MLSFRNFLPLKKALMATLNETWTATSRKYADTKFHNHSPIFFVALLPFCFRIIALKMLNFLNFLPPKEPLVATFSEMCALISKRHVPELGISIPNLSKKRFLGMHSSIFALEKWPVISIFRVFLPLKETWLLL